MKQYKRPSKAQIAAIALTMMAVGGGSYGVMSATNNASAQTPNEQVRNITQNEIPDTNDTDQEINDGNENATEVHGSIQLGAEPTGQEVGDAEEATQYANLATISAAEAQQIAESSVGGTASNIQLGDENGTLIYEVQIGSQEVKVDAGNGAVLAVESGDNEHQNGPDEAAETDGKESENENN